MRVRGSARKLFGQGCSVLEIETVDRLRLVSPPPATGLSTTNFQTGRKSAWYVYVLTISEGRKWTVRLSVSNVNNVDFLQP